MSGGGGAPAVQAQYSYSSPFQNPAYNAVAMGTKQSPGPIARSIQIGNQLAQNWQDSYTGANPGAYYGVTKEQATPQFLANQRVQQGAWSPSTSQTASGVNQFDPERNRMIAAVNPNLPTQTPTPGYTPTAAAAQGGLMSLGNFERGRSSDEAVNPQAYAPGGRVTPKYNAKSSADDKLGALQTAIDGGYKPKPAETKFMQGMADSAAVRQQLGSDIPFSVDPKTGQIKPAARGANQSSADYKAYLGKLDAAGATLDPKAVKQYGVTTGAAVKQQDKTSGVNAPYSMQQAIEQRTAYFDPVTGKSTNPLFNQAVERIQEAQKLPEQFGLATEAYKSGIAGLGEAAKYQAKDVNAAQMAQYQQVAAQKADTERAAAAAMNRGDVREANALMAQVEKYDAAMMSAPADIQAQAYTAAQAQKNQMAGPQSWTDAGTSQKFMNPYMQNVTDIAKRESMRDYGKQLSQLRSQATQSKAFGGTRSAIQEAEAQRAQQQRMSDIEAQGLNEAYKTGMQQFSAEQGLGLQAGQANLSAAQQTDLANQQALNTQRSQYVTQQLEAAKNNYGGQLTAAQANQVADNAARQFNAAAQNTANNNFVAQSLQAQLANQQMDFGVGQMNTQNQQQVNLANAAAANQANQQYAQQQLAAQQANQQAGLTTEQQNAQMRQQAALANQQAGLQANQQNIGAYGQALQGAQGLGALGASQAQTNLANIGALGQAAQAQQNLGQQYLTGVQQSAQNYFNFPQQQLSAPINAINQLPSSGGATTQTQRPASALGWKKGGLMNLRKARRA